MTNKLRSIIMRKCRCLRGGGGGGFTLISRLKLTNKLRPMTELLKGCPQDSHALVWSILPNHLNMLKTMLWGALLVATSLLNTQINYYKTWIKIS